MKLFFFSHKQTNYAIKGEISMLGLGLLSKKFFWPFSNNSGLFQDFRRLRKTSEGCRRFPKAVEDVWRLPKMSEHCRRCPKTAEDVHWDCQRCPQTYDRRYLKTTADLACITHNSSILKRFYSEDTPTVTTEREYISNKSDYDIQIKQPMG